MEAATPSPTPDELEAALQSLLNGPAGVPPAGVTPNFDNPQNLDVLLYVTATLTLSFATFAIIIRIYTKHFLLRAMGYEDCKH